ncbi:interferon lambda-3 isoform X5 [Antechinus flavipes]|uniref:interferon lambda-3 isoform X2 n=1 Tax=Antechinus flavipes TaxID=38775 RepID=UPI0022355FA4|nr:interferon lambda-3 isoform X2 [Antechinus flavipes]XP_051845004.1 interferon lambda-3 isoform X3 [Antechinus flavipes]XP_051845005.1 interferon lambda-3 isoform X4 [Antechinus flavipes]XP_051845006.1 interferon lambda-3 isoform X5 [Antechinus flavipes]
MMLPQALPLLLSALMSGTISKSLAPTLSNLPPERSCQISHFKFLSPREMETFKVAKDAYEKTMLQTERKCSSRFFHRSWDLRQLQLSVRPVVLQAELKLTLEVLKAVTKPELDSVLAQPLQTLSHIHQEIQSCVTSQPSKEHRLPGRLKNWLNKFSEARKEPHNCLEASIMLNLFRLLLQDLRCVAYGDLC